MSTMLGREMNPVERAQLLNMTLHPGYKILRLMMDQACDLATAAVIKLNPSSTDNYKEKLVDLQLIARATNDFCSSLVKSIEAHERIGGLERVEEEDMKVVLEQVEVLRSQQ